MPHTLAATALFFGLLGMICQMLILVHAFRRSLGTGVMVLLIPFFTLFYAFEQFEHRLKGWVVAGYLGSLGVTAGLLVLAR
jgi:hypothetical protein